MNITTIIVLGVMIVGIGLIFAYRLKRVMDLAFPPIHGEDE